MDITQDDFNEAVLAVTSGPAWDIVKQGLSNDIYQLQAGALEAKSWEAVKEARGFAAGLGYIINLSENTIIAIQQGVSDAEV